MNDNSVKSQAIGLAIGGVFAFGLTLCEIVPPLIVFLLSTSSINAIRYSPILQSCSSLLASNIVACVISLILSGSQYMQYKKPFNKKIQILRSVIDITFISADIFCFIVSSSKVETDFRYKLVDEWKKNSSSIQTFEEINKCNNLNMFNNTKSQFCDHFVNKDLSNSYKTTRKISTPMFFFIFGVIISRCAAFFLLRFNTT